MFFCWSFLSLLPVQMIDWEDSSPERPIVFDGDVKLYSLAVSAKDLCACS